jgi:hypothetical protein
MITPEQDKILQDFADNLINNQVDLDPEAAQILEDNFWDLIGPMDGRLLNYNEIIHKILELKQELLVFPKNQSYIRAQLNDLQRKADELLNTGTPTDTPEQEINKKLKQLKTLQEDLRTSTGERRRSIYMAIQRLTLQLTPRNPSDNVERPKIPNNLLTDLVAYWALDEASGTRADSHTNSYDLDVVLNAPSPIAGINGNGVDLELGSTQCLNTTNAGLLSTMSGIRKLSMSCWVRFESIPTSWICRSEQSGHLQYTTAGGLRFGPTSSAGGGGVGEASVSPATTYHVVATFDGTNATAADRCEIYIDGSLVPTTNTYGTIASVTGTCTAFTLGASNASGGAAMDGWLDEFAIWTKTLNATDVANLYKGGTGLFYGDFD